MLFLVLSSAALLPFWDGKRAEKDLAVGSACLHSLWDWLTGEMFRRQLVSLPWEKDPLPMWVIS